MIRNKLPKFHFSPPTYGICRVGMQKSNITITEFYLYAQLRVNPGEGALLLATVW